MASAEFIRVDRDDHRSLIVTGDVDALAQTRFRKFLQDALAEPPKTMHLDLNEVSYFEASSIEVLAHFVKVAMGTPMTLRLSAASTVRSACREHADAEWLLSTFGPFVAAAARRTPMLLLPTVADQLARRDTADYPVLVVVGEVDLATAKDFAAAAIALLNTATVVAHVDLTDVTFFDSSGIAALIEVQRAFAGASVRLVIEPSRSVARTLELTDLTGHFTIGPAPVVPANELSSAVPVPAPDRT